MTNPKDLLNPQQEKEFLEKNKEIVKQLLDNCKDAVEKSDLNTFKQMIKDNKIFRCIMASNRLTYDCSIQISVLPLGEEAAKE